MHLKNCTEDSFVVNTPLVRISCVKNCEDIFSIMPYRIGDPLNTNVLVVIGTNPWGGGEEGGEKGDGEEGGRKGGR